MLRYFQGVGIHTVGMHVHGGVHSFTHVEIHSVAKHVVRDRIAVLSRLQGAATR